MIQIAVLGYGTVGSGVVEVINRNQESINKKAGEEINIKYVLDLRDFPGDLVQEKIVHDYEVIANDPEIKIVVEVMGGTNPAYTFVKRALESGKSVCTSNKELVAKHGVELIRIAKEKNCNFLFEASCGGGIPIIRPLNCSLTADEVDEISGILNGTTNYILSKMTSEGSEFEDVLKNAQELGYAERNPAADIEGWDACRKIAILTAVATGKEVDYEKIPTEGITKITGLDSSYAACMGAAIKLFGTSINKDGKLYLRVVDYKTGTKKLDLREVYCGLDCQMLLYLFSLTRDADGRFTGAEPAGVLYLLADPAPETTTRGKAARSMEYKLDGLVRDEQKVFDAMDAEETGRYLPFSFRGGVPSPYQKEKRADKAKLSRIQLHLDDLVTRMGEQLYSGCIAAEPLVTGRSPCRWCDYGFICCHEDGIGERALDAPAKPFEPPENSDKKKEEDQ